MMWPASGYVVGAALTFVFQMILVKDCRAEDVYFWRIIGLTVLWPFMWLFLLVSFLIVLAGGDPF